MHHLRHHDDSAASPWRCVAVNVAVRFKNANDRRSLWTNYSKDGRAWMSRGRWLDTIADLRAAFSSIWRDSIDTLGLASRSHT